MISPKDYSEAIQRGEDAAKQIQSLQQQLAEANSENDLLRTRLGSILWSGSLDDKTCGTVQKWVEEHKSALEEERDKLKALVQEKDKALDKLIQACPGSQWVGSPPSDVASRAKLLTPANLPRFVPEEKYRKAEDVLMLVLNMMKEGDPVVMGSYAHQEISSVVAERVCREQNQSEKDVELYSIATCSNCGNESKWGGLIKAIKITTCSKCGKHVPHRFDATTPESVERKETYNERL